MRFQKLMWCNMMRSTKSQKVTVLHYSIDYKILSMFRELGLRALLEILVSLLVQKQSYGL
jgi:hypothetical protein